jgi:hypothetical protein
MNQHVSRLDTNTDDSGQQPNHDVGPQCPGRSRQCRGFRHAELSARRQCRGDVRVHLYAGVVQHNYDSYLKTHPKTNGILNAMAAQIAGSVLTTQYWAILPFTFGADNLARYTLVPEPPPGGAPSVNVPNDDPNNLAADLATSAHQLAISLYLHGPNCAPLCQPAAGRGDEGMAA